MEDKIIYSAICKKKELYGQLRNRRGYPHCFLGCSHLNAVLTGGEPSTTLVCDLLAMELIQ